MIDYAKCLLKHEKDNPSTFLRSTYLISNVGDFVKCAGRVIRFPTLAKPYIAEMKLAMGDVLMQCEMMRKENEYEESNFNITEIRDVEKYEEMQYLVINAGRTMHESERNTASKNIILSCHVLCKLWGWNIHEIRHVGFLHIIERFEQFKNEGWK